MAKNPSLEQRYPPGCPDPEWCRGNGCYWRCTCAGDEFCGCAECKAFYAHEAAIPPLKVGETLIDGDLIVSRGEYRGIIFIDSPEIELEPIPPSPFICPQQRGAEPCDCPSCRKEPK